MDPAFNAKMDITWTQGSVWAAEVTVLHARTNPNAKNANRDISTITKPTHAILVESPIAKLVAKLMNAILAKMVSLFNIRRCHRDIIVLDVWPTAEHAKITPPARLVWKGITLIQSIEDVRAVHRFLTARNAHLMVNAQPVWVLNTTSMLVNVSAAVHPKITVCNVPVQTNVWLALLTTTSITANIAHHAASSTKDVILVLILNTALAVWVIHTTWIRQITSAISVLMLFLIVSTVPVWQNAKIAILLTTSTMASAYHAPLNSQAAHHVPSKVAHSVKQVSISAVDPAYPVQTSTNIVYHATSTAVPNASNTTISCKIRPALPVAFIHNIVKSAPKIYVYDAMTSSTSSRTTAITVLLWCRPASHVWGSTDAPNALQMSISSKISHVSSAILSTRSARPVRVVTNAQLVSIIRPILIKVSVSAVKI